MNRTPRICLSLLAAGLCLSAAISPALNAEFRAGAAAVDITPREWPLAPRGGFFPQPIEGANDPLHARCLALDDGTTRLALVVVDSCVVHREQTDPAKARASAATGIPAENIMISATHTHSAPFANARHGTPQELAYQQQLVDGIAEAIIQAAAALEPARAAWGSHDLPDEVFNRRWFLQPGAMPVNPFGEDTDIVKMNPGSDPRILISPAGPVDPGLSVLYVTGEGGRPLSLFANYALHYVGGTGNLMSADYFGEFARLMPVRLNADPERFVAMMSNGTSGDINNNNVRDPRPRREPFEQIRIVASKAADAAARAARSGETASSVSLAMMQREVPLKHRVPTPEQIERAREIMQVDEEGEKKLPRLAKAYAERTLLLAEQPEILPALVQAIRVGDLAICALPFEVFAEIGLELKAKSPAAGTIVVELANDGYGYLPTPGQHVFGGYETWLGTCRVQEDSSVILVENLLEMLGELFP